MDARREVWVTGIGLVTAAGTDLAQQHAVLNAAPQAACGATLALGPYHVRPLAPIDFSTQIASRAEQRQMGTWQRIGVYAAGLALADAGLTGHHDILDGMDLVVAAGNGERDMALDASVLQGLREAREPARFLNETLASGLRPTLYLGELSNLLAGNIQIIHKVAGSSRTYKGEELSGLSALEDGWRRIGGGQSDLILVGGALNAEREDLLLGYELGCNLWPHAFAPVWQRQDAGGGFAPGSAGAFLVLEAAAHARARGARPYARITAVASDRSTREPGAAGRMLEALMASVGAEMPMPVLSGASGVEPVTSEERAVLQRHSSAIRAYGSLLGHTVEAHAPLGVALAALALSKGRFYPPFDDSGVEQPFLGMPEHVLVTSLGHWRGEGVIRLDRIGEEDVP